MGWNRWWGFGSGSVLVGILAVTGACGDEASTTPDSGAPDAPSPPPDSSGGPDAPADTRVGVDTGVDAGADSSDAGAGADAASCSGQNGQGSVSSFFPAQGQVALPIEIEWNGCPTKARASGSGFSWTLTVGSNVSYFRTTTTGFFVTNTQEMSGTIFGIGLPGLALFSVKAIPGFDATKAHVVVLLNEATNPCQKSGSVVAAPGHPEATVTYVNKDGAALVGAAAMDDDGLAVIANLDPAVGATLEPSITSGACQITPAFAPFLTKRTPLVVNTVSIFQAQAKP